MTPSGEVTQLLSDVGRGDRHAADRLLPLVYAELRNLADHYLAAERADHTLQATALVHEAYIRLVGDSSMSWENRAHFFAVASRAMRRILVDHARARCAAKRGGGRQKLSLDQVADLAEQQNEYLVALDEALEHLAALDERAGRIVELRYFGGLTVDETAGVLGVSAKTIKREWQMAKGWLHRQITKGD